MLPKLVIILTLGVLVDAQKFAWNFTQECFDENSTALCRFEVAKKQLAKFVVEDTRFRSNEDAAKFDEDERIDGKFWYESLPIPPVVVATSDAMPPGECKRQMRRYIDELKNGTLWAVQMYDASVKHPYGIIDGHTRHLGSFDQCYRIDSRVPEHIRGRYCLVDYKYEMRYNKAPSFSEKLDIDFDLNESSWEAIKEKGDFRRVKRYLLQLALCVPAACSAKDIQTALRKPFGEFGAKNNIIITVNVDENNCQSYHEEPNFTTGSYVFCAVLFAIICLVIVASLYDGTLITEEEKIGISRGYKMLLCFSAYRNLNTIFDVSYKHRGLDTIHMIRFFMMCCVIVGHRTMQYYYNSTINIRYLELTYKIPSSMMLHNGPIIVDAFFAIGGLLTCYGLLDQFDKSKRMNFLGLTFVRFLRFTPAYALLVFFNAYLFPLMGSGPMWKDKIVKEGENCAVTWWANLFYLNNYVTMDRMCIFQSWYLSVDFHCYLVAIAVIYTFWKCPRWIGYSLFGVVTFIGVSVPFYLTYIYRVQPLFIGFPYLTSISMDSYFVNYYVKTHLRMSAYFVGVIFGAVLYDYQKASWRISKRWSQCLFILLVVVLSIYSQALGFHYYNPNANPSSLEMALYASLHRGVFAASFCFIILLVTVGDGLDFHYNFLTPRWVQPLGRLTYSVFLSHNILQLYHIGTIRTARAFTIHNAFWDFIPDVVYSFSLALLIAIGIEGPFRKLEKHFIMKREKSPRIKDANVRGNEETISKKTD